MSHPHNPTLFYEDLFGHDKKNVQFVERHPIDSFLADRVFGWLAPLLIRFTDPTAPTRFVELKSLQKKREGNDWQGVLDEALARCQVRDLSPSGLPRNYLGEYWMVFGEAVRAGFALNTKSTFTRLLWEHRKTNMPGEGYFAAEALLRLAVFANHRGEKGETISLTKRSIGADPTWAEPSIFAARLSVRGYPFDAARMLRDAIFIDPDRKSALLSDDDFEHLRILDEI